MGGVSGKSDQTAKRERGFVEGLGMVSGRDVRGEVEAAFRKLPILPEFCDLTRLTDHAAIWKAAINGIVLVGARLNDVPSNQAFRQTGRKKAIAEIASLNKLDPLSASCIVGELHSPGIGARAGRGVFRSDLLTGTDPLAEQIGHSLDDFRDGAEIKWHDAPIDPETGAKARTTLEKMTRGVGAASRRATAIAMTLHQQYETLVGASPTIAIYPNTEGAERSTGGAFVALVNDVFAALGIKDNPEERALAAIKTVKQRRLFPAKKV